MFLDLPPITPARRGETSSGRRSQDYPRILGGLLDAVVGGLRELPSVRLTELPRMADFADSPRRSAELGWPADSVLSDYNDNRRDAALTYLEDSPLTDILLELAPHKLDWIRTASDLLAELTAWAGKRVTASPRWPKTPRRSPSRCAASPPKCACTASPLFSSEPAKSVSSRSSAQNHRYQKSPT